MIIDSVNSSSISSRVNLHFIENTTYRFSKIRLAELEAETFTQPLQAGSRPLARC